MTQAAPIRTRRRRLTVTARLDRRRLELIRLEIGQLARRFGVSINTVTIRSPGGPLGVVQGAHHRNGPANRVTRRAMT